MESLTMRFSGRIRSVKYPLTLMSLAIKSLLLVLVIF